MASRRRICGSGLVAALVLIAANPVVAAQSGGGTQVFPADYFESSRPADAYDMVRKLPGFELIDVDEDVRGFAGSRGNVLFDGRPPSGKQESLEEMLRRIPAASVLRIELIRGGARSTATGGYDMVANVVRRRLNASSASLLAGASAADEIGIKPDFRAELSRQSGDRRLDGAIALETDIDDESGRGAIVERELPDGDTEREERDEREVERKLSVDAEYKAPLGSGELVANLSAARERVLERIRSSEDGETSVASERERLWSGEAGAQYRASIGAGELEALAVQRLGRLRVRSEEDEESFDETRRTSESIARAEYRWGPDELRFLASAEAALNRLTSEARLAIDGVEVPIAGSDVNVSEKRGEVAFGAVWKASPSLTVEPSLRTELSNIRSTGDSAQDDSFLFLKPRVRASWSARRTHLQFTVEREAAQLDFGDYVASAELGRDDVVAGATSLRPPVTWSVSGTLEQRFWDDGVVLLSVRNEWIDDVIDRVAVEQDGELFDAIGNIGKGTRRVIRGELTLPLSRMGIAGMQLRAAVTFLRSRVTDPVTGQKRIISEDRPVEGELRLTHDIPGGRWSYGFDAALAHSEREFRFDEVRRERIGAAVGAYVEFRPSVAWRLRVEADNITSRSLREERREFDGLRSSGELESIEERRLRTAPIVMFSVRRAFGASERD